MKKRILMIFSAMLLMSFCACTSGNISQEATAETDQKNSLKTEASSDSADEKQNTVDGKFLITANGKTLTARFADNSSAEAFKELLSNGEITVDMQDYGGFEKVGDLPQELPSNDERITTEPGDVILYLGRKITVYYDKNTWNFTRLGKIENAAKEKLLEIFTDGNVSVTFSLAKSS